MTLPGISDAERLSNLLDELVYAKRELQDAEAELRDAQFKHSGAYAAYSQANYKYVAHLEMMAAGVATK